MYVNEDCYPFKIDCYMFYDIFCNLYGNHKENVSQKDEIKSKYVIRKNIESQRIAEQEETRQNSGKSCRNRFLNGNSKCFGIAN